MSERISLNPTLPYKIDSLSFEMRYGDGFQRSLLPCQPILDQSVKVGILENGQLKLRRFAIQRGDADLITVTTSTGVVTYDRPGKSAFIFFENSVDKSSINNLSKHVFQKESDRRDHIHLATVESINNSGWDVVWTPLQKVNNFLHVRLVPKNNTDESNVENLFKVFNKII